MYVILLPTFVYIPDLGYLQSHTFRQKHAKQVCITQLLTLFPTFIGAKAFKHVHDLHRPNLLVILDSNLPNITICHRWLVFTWVTAWKSANSLSCHRNQDGHQSGDLHTFYFIPQTNQVLTNSLGKNLRKLWCSISRLHCNLQVLSVVAHEIGEAFERLRGSLAETRGVQPVQC